MSQLLSPLPAQGILVTLGDLTLEDSDFDRTKPLLLLCYLCLEGSKERRHLAELFWPGAADPLASLATEFSRLKRHLGNVVDADASHARAFLQTDAQIFLRALERQDLNQAAAVYKGAFLNGVTLKTVSAELEEWVYGTREFLAGRACDALLGLGEAAARRGDFTEAARRAHKACTQVQPTVLQPERLRRAYTLLVADNHPWATTLQKEARNLNLFLDAGKVEARQRLRPTRGDALPGDATSFVGRGAEIRDVAALLRGEARLVTVVGLAGMGKSRLAAEVVRNLQAEGVFPDGVYPVWLVALTRPDDVPTALARALGLVKGQEDPLEGIARHIEDKRALVYFENYEHVIEGAPFLSELLARCPKLKILITSRERLNLEEEWTFWLEGLPFKRQGETGDLSEAAQLFVQRAKRVAHDFSPTEKDLSAVEETCRRVEGSPLAVELAASWTRVMPCADIAMHLRENQEVLQTTLRNVPERHRSIEAAFERSWKLLSAEERRVLRELSVFRGGFSREAAGAVVSAGLSVLVSLVDKSLLKLGEDGRFGRHPLLYEFTRAKLSRETLEPSSVYKAHAAYYSAFLGERRPLLEHSQSGDVAADIERELDNIKTAWSWWLQHELTSLVLAAKALGAFFRSSHRAAEGVTLLSQASEIGKDAPGLQLTRATLLLTIANLILQATEQPEQLDRAVALVSESLHLFDVCDDREGVAQASKVLGGIAWRRSRYGEARMFFERSLENFRSLGNLTEQAGLLGNLGLIAYSTGAYDAAKQRLGEAVSGMRQVGHHYGLALFLFNIADLEINYAGDLEAATSALAEALNISQHHHFTGLVPKIFKLSGKLAMRQDKLGEAVRWFSEALVVFTESSNLQEEVSVRIYLAHAELRSGEVERAVKHLLSSLTSARELGVRKHQVSALAVMADLYLREGNIGEAARLLLNVSQEPEASYDERHQAETSLSKLDTQLTSQLKLELSSKTVNDLVNESVRYLEVVATP